MLTITIYLLKWVYLGLVGPSDTHRLYHRDDNCVLQEAMRFLIPSGLRDGLGGNGLILM